MPNVNKKNCGGRGLLTKMGRVRCAGGGGVNLNFEGGSLLFAVEVYKCVRGLNRTYLNDLFTEPLANYNFRDKYHLHQPQFHTYTYGFRSFKYSGSKLWNSLPRAIQNTNDINEFEKNVTEWCQTCDLSRLEIFWSPFPFQIQAITMYPFVTFTGVVY